MRDVMDEAIRFLSRFVLVAMLLLTAIIVPLKLFDNDGLPRVRRLSADLAEVQRANREIEEENRTLREEIRLFHSEPEYLERVARDQLGMVGPTDLVFQFSSPAEPH
jgi:cell division protein FtsB